MDKKLQLACNLRFNPNNPHHAEAARMLSMIAPRYKTTFVSLAIEAYMETHPGGIDMNALFEAAKEGRKSYQPKSGIVENLNKKKEQAAREESQLSDRMIDNALDFYDIE